MAVKSSVQLQVEAAEGGLKELVLSWFTQTQAPLILRNGNFPDWFQGLAARNDAEDQLKDKDLGSFLVRLSEKTLGYILSYRGHDRCRHFVISQKQDGRFVIAGDCQLFDSLTELIEHYKINPIQPFGEFLTSTCCQDDTGDLYDVVNAKKNSGVSVQALRTMWDQKKEDQVPEVKSQRTQPPQKEAVLSQAPALPPKSSNRKLTGTVSVDGRCLSQVLPPVPKRGMPLGFTQTGSLPDTTPHPSEAQTRSNKTQRLPVSSNQDPASKRDTNAPDHLHRSDELHQVESRSQSLPYLVDNRRDEEEAEPSNQVSSLSLQPPSPPNRLTCQTYSLHAPPEGPTQKGSKSEQQSDKQDQLKSNTLYESVEGPGGRSGQQAPGVYAQVSQGSTPTKETDDTYELIPVEASMVQNNTYESLEDLKTTKPKSTWGKSNKIFKKFMKK